MTVIIGEKKKAVDLPLMDQSEIAQLREGTERMLEQGVPLEVPAAVRIADLIRITKTMQAYADITSRVVELLEEDGCYVGGLEEMKELRDDAFAALNPPPVLITPTPSPLEM